MAMVASDLTRMGVEVLTEVPGLFTSVIPEAARVRLRGLTPRAVSALVPDLATRGFSGDSPLATYCQLADDGGQDALRQHRQPVVVPEA